MLLGVWHLRPMWTNIIAQEVQPKFCKKKIFLNPECDNEVGTVTKTTDMSRMHKIEACVVDLQFLET